MKECIGAFISTFTAFVGTAMFYLLAVKHSNIWYIPAFIMFVFGLCVFCSGIYIAWLSFEIWELDKQIKKGEQNDNAMY